MIVLDESNKGSNPATGKRQQETASNSRHRQVLVPAPTCRRETIDPRSVCVEVPYLCKSFNIRYRYTSYRHASVKRTIRDMCVCGSAIDPIFVSFNIGYRYHLHAGAKRLIRDPCVWKRHIFVSFNLSQHSETYTMTYRLAFKLSEWSKQGNLAAWRMKGTQR